MTGVIQRKELLGATLNLGGAPVDLTDYATTGLRMIAIGPSGSGKTNAGLVICEQLAEQGWVAILVDPEKEIRGLYSEPVASPEALAECLAKRDQPIVVIDAPDATAFIPYGEVISEAADAYRKPIVLMMDEGQIFSVPRAGRNSGAAGETTDIVNDMAQRGRKRGLDIVITAHRFTGSINRTLFGNMNLTLVGQQADSTVWTHLSPLFRSHRVAYGDLASLAPGEFFCLSRRGLDRFRLPLAKAMEGVAIAARPSAPMFPTNFAQWDRAMASMSSDRLGAISDEVIDFLATIAGLTPVQVASGRRALADERDGR